MREQTTRGMMPHEWGPAALGHGAQQCLHCLCTDREAAFALGPRCPERRPMAAGLARRLHEGQRDQGGEEYYLHPWAVADRLLELWPDAPLHAVEGAYLHDSIEDGRATWCGLAAAGVTAGGIAIARRLDRKAGPMVTYREHIRGVCEAGDVWLVRVKLCDNWHNSLGPRALPGSGIVERRYGPARAALEEAEARLAAAMGAGRCPCGCGSPLEGGGA
jgi:hypothetical protein